MHDNWFSRLTGFNEGPYSTTKELLEVNGPSWYNERQIKISLGALSPIEYWESLGLAA